MAKRIDDEALIRTVLSNPHRLKILRLMQGQGPPLAPKDAATELDVPLNKLAYHFVVLARNRVILEVEKTLVRGAFKHFYRLNHELLRRPRLREFLREQAVIEA